MNIIAKISKTLATLVLIVVIGFEIAYLIPEKPCAKPIPYYVNTFDTRFNISRDYFIDKTKKAIDLWNKAVGKEVFVYKEVPTRREIENKKAVAVNLVYDQRQAETELKKVLDKNIDAGIAQADFIKSSYEALEKEYSVRAEAYEKAVANYKNSNGRIGDYDSLERDRLILNDLADRINQGIREYNQIAHQVNQTIKDFNSSSDEEFTEGIYSTADNSIYIYQFDDESALLRALTHEFGHAIGVDHNENPDSIMHSVNKSKSQVLSTEDIYAIQAVCEDKSPL